MVIMDLLVTLLILGINVAMLFLFFIGLRYLDTKLIDSKHRESIMITAMFIYSTVMIISSTILKEWFTILWG
ncbi:hypothetical protein [Mammaliicoccus phage vB_MscM-PMS3]|nr:hypothetical protein [Mammaliicoccus phage vB_MscM-PMS3]